MVQENVIIQAIKEKKTLKIDYDGGIRMIEPHTFAKNRKSNVVISAYQTAGFSESGDIPDWRLFKLEKVKKVEITDNTFKVREGYNPESKMFIEVFAQV